MSRPDPGNPVSPLLQVMTEIQHLSDDEILKLERTLNAKIQNASGLNNERVDAAMQLISSEKSRRDL